jgi:hypothetical protein
MSARATKKRFGTRAAKAAWAGAVMAAAWLAAAPPAAAQTKTGTTMGAFLLIEPSARYAAMGNTAGAMARGLDGVYYNPAAIASIERHGVAFSHAAWFADIGYDHVIAAIPAGRWGSAYAAVTALNSGEIDVRTVAQPLGTGERFSVSDVAIGVGFGRRITDRFSAGGQVTFVQETIWHSSANTITVGVGTLYRVSEAGFHIGASLSHYGTEAGYDGRDLRITYDNDPTRYGDNGALPAEIFTGDFPVPVLFRLGAGAPFTFGRDLRLEVAVDALHPSDNDESANLGAELEFAERVALRAGYQNAFLADSEVGLTFGAGVRGDTESVDYRLDYGWADHGRLGDTHRFTVGIEF